MPDWKDRLIAKTELTSPDNAADLLVIVDMSADLLLKTTPNDLLGPGVAAGTGKTTPVDGDLIPLVDSAASNAAKKLTWANLKATLKTYFDALYYAIGGTDVAVADGGTGSSTASGARTNLGLVIGTDVQAHDSDLDTWAGITPGTNVGTNLAKAADGSVVDAIGFRGIPQNSQSAAYTTVMADSGKEIFHPSSDANARTFTIDSNANVAYPIGTVIVFTNDSANAVTIAITSDTLVLVGTGATGSRTLAQYGQATARKVGSTRWYISGTNLT